MSFATKHKKGSIDWGIDTEGKEYKSLEELYDAKKPDKVFMLRGLFINRNKPEKQLKDYGPSLVAISDECLVNLPNHLEEDVMDILHDEDDVADIKAGKVGFTIRNYESHGKTCYSPNWVDVLEK